MTSFRNPLRFNDDNPFTGRHMLALILAFFGTVVSVNLVMAFFATGTFPGLVVKNSYVASQNYNRALAETRAQAATGWRMAIGAEAGIVAVTLEDRDGTPLGRLAVTAAVGRPSTTQQDRIVDLVETPAGYRATEALAPGQWEVAVEVREDDVLVFAGRERIHVAGGPG